MPEQLPFSSASPPISESLWWAIPSRLAGIRKPTEDDLPVLKKLKIRALVSVLNDLSNLESYERHNIPYLWLPIDGGTPPRVEQLEKLRTFVDVQNDLGNAIAIHCSNGRRRTGTVLAALLIQQGSDYESAMATIQTANPAVELRAAQISFLQNLSSISSI